MPIRVLRFRLTMNALANLVLSYVLWPALILVVLVLWVAAMSDIVRHRSGGIFTSAELLCTAALVSVAATIAVAGMSAVLDTRWIEAVSRANPDVQASRQGDEDPARAYLFSFGLEHASYSSSADSRIQIGEKRRK